MHGNVLLICNTKLCKYFPSNQANMEITEDKHENESKLEELAGNFIGFKINIWKDNIALNEDIKEKNIKRKIILPWKELCTSG